MLAARRFRARHGSPRYVALYHVTDLSFTLSHLGVRKQYTVDASYAALPEEPHLFHVPSAAGRNRLNTAAAYPVRPPNN